MRDTWLHVFHAEVDFILDMYVALYAMKQTAQGSGAFGSTGTSFFRGLPLGLPFAFGTGGAVDAGPFIPCGCFVDDVITAVGTTGFDFGLPVVSVVIAGADGGGGGGCVLLLV